MADRFAYITRQIRSSEDFDEQISIFSQNNVMLCNPLTNHITAINETGEQIVVSLEWIRDKINEHSTVSWQWWLDDATDIYCRFRFIEDTVIEEYGLDGLGDNIINVNKLLCKWFMALITNQSGRGIVIDNEGVTGDYDWDAFFCGQNRFMEPLPTLLGIRSIHVHRVKSLYKNNSIINVGEYSIYTKTNELTRLFLSD